METPDRLGVESVERDLLDGYNVLFLIEAFEDLGGATTADLAELLI